MFLYLLPFCMLMNPRLLEDIGLTKLEIKVYLAMLDFGSASAGQISSVSGVHRRSVYDALDRLLEKGLVAIIAVNNRKEYQAVNPNRLLDLMKERESNVQEAMPELLLKFNMSREKSPASFFKGKEGIKAIFDDQLRVGKTIHVISGNKNAYELLPYYIKHYDAERKRRNIKIRIMFNNNAKIVGKPPVTEIKYLPEVYGGLAAVNIYGDNVAIILWSEDTPMGIVISNKEIADTYMNYFNILWKIAEK